MKKLLLFTAALLCAANMSAYYFVYDYHPAIPKDTANLTHGPWTFLEVNNGIYDTQYTSNLPNRTAKYNSIDSERRAWYYYSNTDHTAITYFWNDEDGVGFSIHCTSEMYSIYGVFSLFEHSEKVPAYTRKRLTWNYTVAGRTNRYTHNVTLYAHNNLSQLKSATVDFTGTYTGKTDSPYYLANKQTNNDRDNPQDKTERTAVLTKTFDFDNRSGSSTQTKSWYLMLTHVTVESSTGARNCHQWGCFRHEDDVWETFYYKHITFNANGGSGKMNQQTIENSGNLTANSFTRTNYAFAGWATAPDGEAVYTNGAAITATENDKGALTLYAVWKPTTGAVEALIAAIGEVEYTPACKARIEAARAAYNNDLNEEEKAQVSNYAMLEAAEADYAALDNVVKLISKIGLIPSYTEEYKAKIDAARAAYDALDDSLKPKVLTYSLLLVAENLYAVSDTKAKIDSIPTPVVHTEACKAKIDAARAAYDALIYKKFVTAAQLEKLQDAEATYAEMDGGRSISFVDKEGETIRSQMVELEYPEAPTITGFTFLYWQPIAEDITEGTIRIQAVYKSNTPTAIDSPTTNDERLTTNKFIRQGNLYILKDEFIYTINGQRVK